MSYLLDTNVVSELRRSKRQAEPTIRTWVSGRKPSDLYLSAITVLEVELSIARLGRRDAVQAERLQTWFEDDLLAVFDGASFLSTCLWLDGQHASTPLIPGRRGMH